jgi:hypothetical protein
MTAPKSRYRSFCALDNPLPIFSQPWWLDATAGDDNWDVAIVEVNKAIVAVLPYTYKRRFGFKILSQPPLTQKLGPWILDGGASYSIELSKDINLLNELMKQLPNFDYYAQNWSFDQSNWLPFYWNNFKQATFYTYILPDLSDEKALWDGFKDNTKWEIRKASNKFGLQVRNDLSLEDFLRLNDLSYKRQGLKPPCAYSYLKRLDQACVSRGARKIFIAVDDQGRQHAGIYLVWDKNSAYYLMGGGDPELRNSGATSLCLWEAIQFSRTVTKSFDFEGSMLKTVERFFRSFGAIQTPYFNVSKASSRLIKIFLFLREFRG